MADNGKTTNLLSPKEIDNRIGYHPANDTTAPLHEEVRKDVIRLMKKWNRNLPAGRELALAFTDLQSAAQWANTAIACGADGSPPSATGAPVPEAAAANERAGAKEPSS